MSGIPWFEGNWEQGEDGKEEWVPLFVLRPSLYTPTRYLEIPGVFKDGKTLVDGEWVDPPMNLSTGVIHPANRKPAGGAQ